MNLNRTHTKAKLWNEYKRLTNPTTRELVFRRPGTTKRVILNEIKRIKKLRKRNLQHIKKQKRLKLEERRKIQKKFRAEILPEIKKPPLYQITPQITIYHQRYGADTIETIETIVNPIIEHTGRLSIDEDKRKTKIFSLIKAFIDELETASGHIRVVNSGETPPFDFSNNGIYRNERYKTLQRDTQFEIVKTLSNGKEVMREYQDLVLRATENPLLYSLGLNDVIIHTKDNECILNDIIHHFQGENRFKNITRESILQEMSNTTGDITVKDIINWCSLKEISLYLIGINNELLDKFIYEQRRYKGLFIKVANNHAYLIDDEEIQQQIIHNSYGNIQAFINWNDAELHNVEGDIIEVYENLHELKEAEGEQILIITEIKRSEEWICNNLNDLVLMIYDKENLFIENVSLDKHGNITGFSYYEVWVIFNTKYHQIEEILDVAREIPSLTNKNLFSFRNQAIQNITTDILEQHNGRVLKSNLSLPVYKIFTQHIKGGYNETIDKIIKKDECKTLDIAKCHTSILYSRQEQWGIFSPIDEFKPYRGYIMDGAKYMILRGFNIGNVKLNAGIYDVELVLNCINEGILTHDDIYKELIPSRTLPAGFFQEIIELLFKLIPTHAKDLINLFIGSLGSHKQNHLVGELSNSKEHREVWHQLNNKVDTPCYKSKVLTEIIEEKPIYMLFKSKETQRIETNLPIYQAIIDMSYWALYQLEKKAVGKDSKIMKFHTDSITIKNPNNVIGEQLFIETELNIGHIREEERLDDGGYNEKEKQRHDELFSDDDEEVYEPPPKRRPNIIFDNFIDLNKKDWKKRTVNDFNEIIKNNESLGLFGKPGRGKTFRTAELRDAIEAQGQRVIATSLSYKAVDNLRKHKLDGLVIKALFSKKPYQTGAGRLQEISRTYDYIIVDEYTINGCKDMEAFYKLYKMGVKFIFVGDYHQLAPIDTHRKLNYRKCNFFKEMCGYNYIELTKNYRFDEGLDELIGNIYDKGVFKLPEPYYKECRFNITYTNKTRKQINNMFSCSNEKVEVRVKLNDWWCKKGSPIVCKFNMVSKGLFNNRIFDLECWDNENYILKDDEGNLIEVDIETASKKTKDGYYNLEIGHALTCHSAQGSTIQGDICIWDTNHPKITREYLYTALSRATALKHIYIHDYKELENIKHETYDDIGGKPLVYNRNKAFKGNVYELYDTKTNEPFYIGSTERELEERYNEHLYKSQQLRKDTIPNVYNYIRDNRIKFKIKLIEIVNYDDIKDLRNREFEIIQQYLKNGETIYNRIGIRTLKTKKLKEGAIKKKEKMKAKGCISIEKDNKGGCIVFIYYVKGKRHKKKVRFSKRKTQKEAMEEIKKLQNEIYS